MNIAAMMISLLLIVLISGCTSQPDMREKLGSLTRYMLDVAPANCIQGTTATFMVRNVGDSDTNVNNTTIKDLDNLRGSLGLAWTDLSGSPISVLKSGETGRATLTSPCTTKEIPKTCNYELSIAGSDWKMPVAVFCSG